MRISYKKPNKAPIGVNAAKIVAVNYAFDKQGEYKTLLTGEKGFEVTFKIIENDFEMKFIFWLRTDLEYQVKSLWKATLNHRRMNYLYAEELLHQMVYIIVQEEIFYQTGELVVDIKGIPISKQRIFPMFFPYSAKKKPKIQKEKLQIVTYLDEKSNLVYKKNPIDVQEASSL